MAEGYRIDNFRELSREEEAYLITRWQKQRCYASRTKVIESNQKFVAKAARKYIKKYSHVEVQDLIGYANLGFIHALNTFDVSQGTTIRTHAIAWIIQHIQRYVESNESCVRIPANIHEQIRKKVAAKTELDDCERGFMDNCRGTIRIDDPIGDDDSSLTILEKYSYINHVDHMLPDHNSIEGTQEKEVSDLLKELENPIDREVMKYLFGIEYSECSLREVGDMFNMSHENVRKIRNSSFKAMRAKVIKDRLKMKARTK